MYSVTPSLELGLFSTLRAIASSVLFEPKFDALTPDFRVRFADTEVVMEVTILAPETTSNASSSVQQALRKLEEIDLKGYYVSSHIKKLVDSDTKTTRLRKCLETWINDLAFSGILRSELKWNDGSWKIRFNARKYDGAPNERNHIIDYALEDLAIWHGLDEDESFKTRIREKVRGKSDAYGSLDKILVVAVAPMGDQGYINSIPIENMLFDANWKRRKVSAVLYKPVSNPWELYGENYPWALVHNPFANNPLERALFSFAREYIYQNGEWLSLPPTTNVRSVVGLSPHYTL